MSRIRVAYFNHTEAVGGAETSLGLLLGHIDKKKIEPKLFCPQGRLSDRARQMQIDFGAVPIRNVGFARSPARMFSYAASMLSSARSLARALDAFDPDVLHANTIRAGFIAGMARALTRPRYKLVVHLRDCLPPGVQSGLIERVIRHQADRIVAISQYVVEQSEIGRSAGRKIVVIPNGVNHNAYAGSDLSGDLVKDELGIAGCSPTFSAVGQITPWKGQIDVIRAFGKIAEQLPASRLLIVGEAKFAGAESRYDTVAYERRLRAEVTALGLEKRVIFTGERMDMPEVMAATDVLVLASWEEPFGRVLIEAMAAGKPTVATRAGGVPEIVIDGETGILVAPRDPDGLAEAMVRLGKDEQLRQRMGLQGSVRASEHFGIELHAAKMTELYAEMVAGNESRDSQ